MRSIHTSCLLFYRFLAMTVSLTLKTVDSTLKNFWVIYAIPYECFILSFLRIIWQSLVSISAFYMFLICAITFSFSQNLTIVFSMQQLKNFEYLCRNRTKTREIFNVLSIFFYDTIIAEIHVE